MHNTTVYGIDVAPAKGLCCFTAGCFDSCGHKPERVPNPTARAFEMIEEIENTKIVNSINLLCWDAPLTGPPAVYAERTLRSVRTDKPRVNPFAQRAIERFFSTKDYEHKAPPGISVQPYSGCSHWAITRALVGLPVTGKFDRSTHELPFTLITENTEISSLLPGNYIIEVHPAVAIWLWLKRDSESEDERNSKWKYKGATDTTTRKRNREEIVSKLLEIESISSLIDCNKISKGRIEQELGNSDDKMDAFVAWVLGELWLKGSNEVILLGNADHGSMLLPKSDSLLSKWKDFVDRNTIKLGG
ncbi:DUF429 domain-containing protein [Alkalispirochaeta alkalica]|uniref:DUF429 domain-containing protein n=1 Tax=Alkalispirochaeta alkalica TaxID=46356 RepID=UPI0012FE47B7|nr:DUF429 domain-containing protein [Alkalispirochaeta alkalica]